ncbi:MAG: MFS transporter [Chitinophagaceae bacterium]|nr:MFS transporter [Chitinophagaceae bacterium]
MMSGPVLRLLLVATIDRIILQGIYPILPLLIAEKGADARMNSVFMAVTYLAIAIGSWLTPAIMSRFRSVSRLSMVVGLLTAVFLLVMGVSSNYYLFLLGTSLYWFLCGVQINVFSIMMSYVSTEADSGKNFGLLANTTLLGAVLGGFMMGPVLQFAGAVQSFTAFAVVSVLVRFVLMSGEFDKVYQRFATVPGNFRLSARVWLLLIALNAGIMLSFTGRFNLSLMMRSGGFQVSQVSNLFALGALIVFPLPYLFGLLSQKISGKWLLMLTLLSVTGALFLLATTKGFGYYLGVSVLIGIMTYCSRGVSQKIFYDQFPIEEQKHAQSVLSSSGWVAAILGFLIVTVMAAGFSLEQVSVVGIIIGLSAVVVLFLTPIKR